jgi:hypothetical protein
MLQPVVAQQLVSLAEAQINALQRGAFATFGELLEERQALERQRIDALPPPAVRALDAVAEALLRSYLLAAQAELAYVRQGIGAPASQRRPKAPARRPASFSLQRQAS